jgi:hypothetical protein
MRRVLVGFAWRVFGDVAVYAEDWIGDGVLWDALDALACEAFPCLVFLRSKEGGTLCGEDRALGAF